MEKEAITSPAAPAAVGPYSQAIRCGELLFLSGQIPLDPVEKRLVSGDIGAQTERVLRNLEAVLAAAHANLNDVVKTTIYLVDLNDFARVNEVYGAFFNNTPPARATVQVSALPLGARVEIDAIAQVPQRNPG
jgi:2-iminobutanoate/2-iminopropanoate deaminase